ncbi:MAG TPA: hypothetical protein VKT73_13840 [Xanthobacteraceae bacterium]|nr:hypothetical protein [Xanthobacteraceae bacterium]
MFDFNRLLNWKLLPGSHEFPGPDGGTCINEAAIVAAGFPYRQVCSVNDCPPCFSRPLASYALGLNDGILDDALRQRLLMPFVTRLAGSADSLEVERTRVEAILFGIVTRLVPQSVESYGCTVAAETCRSATSFDEAAAALDHAFEAVCGLANKDETETRKNRRQDYLEGMSKLVSAFAYCGDDKRVHEAASWAATAVTVIVTLQDWGRLSLAAREPGYVLAAAFLAESLAIGNQAAPLETEVVAARLESAKRKTTADEPVAA